MAETFLALLAAHLIADFPLQPNGLIRRKRNPWILCSHAVIVGAIAAAALGNFPLALLAILVGTHLAMDAIKIYILGDTLASFLLDQTVHLIVTLALAIAFPAAVLDGWWGTLGHRSISWYCAGLTLVAAAILSVSVGAVLIKKATAIFSAELQSYKGLKDGGYYIGCLERLLVMLLVLLNEPAGIGLMITVKSILRFGDLREEREWKLTEYVIIGTFMSFGWGLLIAIMTKIALQHWLPVPIPQLFGPR